MKLPKTLTQVTLFSKLVALALFVTLPFIGFWFGMRYYAFGIYRETTARPTIAPLATPAPKSGHIASNSEQFVTRDLHFKLPEGSSIKMDTNIYFGDNWTFINPYPFSNTKPFILKAVSGDFRPTISYKNYLKATITETFYVSGVKGELIIGVATPPSGPEITCPGCYLSGYKTGEKVAIALIKQANNYYSFEGEIDQYGKSYRQILSSFTFSSK